MNQILVVVFEHFDQDFTKKSLKRFHNLSATKNAKFINYYFAEELGKGEAHESQLWDIIICNANKLPEIEVLSSFKSYKKVYLSVPEDGKLNAKQQEMVAQYAGRKLHNFVINCPKADNPIRKVLSSMGQAFATRSRNGYMEGLAMLHEIFEFDVDTEAKLQLLNACWNSQNIDDLVNHRGWAKDYRTKKHLLALLNMEEVLNLVFRIRNNQDSATHIDLMEKLNKLLFKDLERKVA